MDVCISIIIIIIVYYYLLSGVYMEVANCRQYWKSVKVDDDQVKGLMSQSHSSP